MKTIFLVTIEIKTNAWDYKEGMKIIIPVNTNSGYNAEKLVENRFCGSEYPLYNIVSIEKSDSFLFKPILSKEQ